MIKSQLDNVNP